MAITVVQTAHAGSTSSVASVTATLPSPPTAGNKLLAFVGNLNSGKTFIISSTNATWNGTADKKQTSGIGDAQWFQSTAVNASAGAAITATVGASSTDIFSLVVYEVSGLIADATALDKTSGAGGNGTAKSAGTTATTTQADEIVLAGWSDNSGITLTFTPGSGFTAPANAQHADGAIYYAVMSEYKVVSATGAQTATGTTNDNGSSWVGALVTYKAAASIDRTGVGAVTATKATASGAGVSTARSGVGAVTATKATVTGVGRSLPMVGYGAGAYGAGPYGRTTALFTSIDGVAAGTSSASATRITENHALSGSAAGTSSVSATRISSQQSLAGQSAGASTVPTALLRLNPNLTGASVTATTAAASGIGLPRVLTGVAAGASTAVATQLTLARALQGSSAGSSTANGSINGGTPGAILSGAVAGLATVTGQKLTIAQLLTGVATGAATASATRLSVQQALAATVTGQATVVGAITRLSLSLVGDVQASSTATGQLSVQAAGAVLAGIVNGVTGTSSTLTVDKPPIPLTGTVAAFALASATKLSLTSTLQGSATGVASVAGFMYEIGPPIISVYLARAKWLRESRPAKAEWLTPELALST